MAARKLMQEVEKCFKKVAEGVQEFDDIYEKIEQASSQAQKEKLEDSLKREIKKLQRLRDQIKTWAASNDIKDKSPLMEQRKIIESRMEKFKAVEKLMKTKAFSKEGLSAAATLDPREKAKIEAGDFLGTQIDELEQRIEALEAEREALQSVKKGKKSKDNAGRMAEIDEMIEKHKWHQGKLELIRRSLVNGGVDADQVNEIKDAIQYYVQEGESADYVEDDTMYDDLNLDEEEDQFGIVQENDKISSQDAQSVQDEVPEVEARSASAAARGKERASADPASSAANRKSSSQLKSPLPTLATLHTPTPATAQTTSTPAMKPAAVPTRPPGEGLKYASAAAAAADKNNVGIAPLPPPPSAHPALTSLPAGQSKTSSTSSPSISSIQMAAAAAAVPHQTEQKPAPAPAATSASSNAPTPAPSTPRPEALRAAAQRAAGKAPAAAEPSEAPTIAHTNGVTNGVKPAEPAEEESIYHLPSSLDDLVEAWEATKANVKAPLTASTQRLVAASRESAPDVADSEPIRIHQPESWWDTSATWPKESLALVDNPALYQPSKVDNDTLFYAFYYKQGSYQQYLSAKALKDQAWRFHKQYQTWFQRHEEPKNITEEFEQGTYRFFDYESTWLVHYVGPFGFSLFLCISRLCRSLC